MGAAAAAAQWITTGVVTSVQQHDWEGRGRVPPAGLLPVGGLLDAMRWPGSREMRCSCASLDSIGLLPPCIVLALPPSSRRHENIGNDQRDWSPTWPTKLLTNGTAEGGLRRRHSQVGQCNGPTTKALYRMLERVN
ncbi:MAG: hypothetical protein Q9159_000725 [Coniocarpon cinnabarinum]